MKYLKNLSVLMCLMAAGIGASVLSGCEWSGGGGAQSYSGRYNFLNFSGVYRGDAGGLLVTDYTKTGGNSTNLLSNETIATGNGSKTAFSGTLNGKPIVPGSITIDVPPFYTFNDTDGNGTMTINPPWAGATGIINYDTGTWALTFPGALAAGEKIRATYKAKYSSFSGGSDGSSGSSGKAIYSFNVEHFGNNIELVDNNGSVYSGSFGDIRSTGGLSQDATTGSVSVGASFIGSFSVQGVSAANVKVKIVGTFNGIVSAVSGGSFVLGSRTITGNWIEENGKVGNVAGVASDATLAAP